MYEKEENWKKIDYWKYYVDHAEEIIKDIESKNKKIKGKEIMGINAKYFVDHAEEIINDTEHLISVEFIHHLGLFSETIDEKYPGLENYTLKFEETHKEMDHFWGFYARRLTDEEYGALWECVNRKYCEDTADGIYSYGNNSKYKLKNTPSLVL